MLGRYQAVSIQHGTRCCQAVQQFDGRRFLSMEAPHLPLAGCSNPDHCQCRYAHHTDRREDARRDTDIGLPDRFFHGPNRRQRAGRRANDAA